MKIIIYYKKIFKCIIIICLIFLFLSDKIVLHLLIKHLFLSFLSYDSQSRFCFLQSLRFQLNILSLFII